LFSVLTDDPDGETDPKISINTRLMPLVAMTLREFDLRDDPMKIQPSTKICWASPRPWRIYWMTWALLLSTFCGCQVGRSIQDREYQPYQRIGRTSWKPGSVSPSQSVPTGIVKAGQSESLKLQSQETVREVDRTDGKIQRLNTPPSTIDEGVIDEIPAEWLLGSQENNSPVSAVVNYVDIPEEIPVDSVSRLIRLAIERNPQVVIARKELEKACARIPQAASLDDPMVDVLAWPIYPNVPQTAAGRMTADISISQTVPWRGKREARVGEVAREVDGLQNRLWAVQLKIANEVKQAYYEHALAVERTSITQQELQFIDELYQRAEILYQTGRVGQQDLLRLQAERGMIQAEQARWEQDRLEATAELLRLLQFEDGKELDFHSYLPEELRLNYQLAESLQRARQASPELQALWSDLQRDQWRVQQARLDYYPDLTFMVGWGGMTTRRALAPFADGIDNINTGVSFNLPSRRARRDAAVRESESQVVQSIKQWELGQDDIARDIRQIHAQLDSQQAQWQLLNQSVIPRFLEAIEISLIAYESNQSDLTELIGIRREILRFKLIERELRSQWYITKGNLDLLIAEVDW